MFDSLNKNNLHHAYLIEGNKEEILPELLRFLEMINISTTKNPDLCCLYLDSFKIEHARQLKNWAAERSFFKENIANGKKIFIISVNNFLLEAQNALLKMFEEPIKDTHFFLIIPNKNILLKTLLSRLHLIKIGLDPKKKKSNDSQIVEFLSMPLSNRLNFIKQLLIEDENKEEKEKLNEDNEVSTHSKSQQFLNRLEETLYEEIFLNKNISALKVININFFYKIFRAREILYQPGSSAKNIMESIAIITPKLIINA